jgi:hypothetical protein
MNNAGSHNSEESRLDSAHNQNTLRERPLPWPLLVVVGLGLLLALYTATQVIGVLYGLAAPPEPPLPSRARENSHISEAHGQDKWVYYTEQPMNEVINFFVEQGGQCDAAVNPVLCVGRQDFSIFMMRWEAAVAEEGSQTRIDISRQISWTGYFPTETP